MTTPLRVIELGFVDKLAIDLRDRIALLEEAQEELRVVRVALSALTATPLQPERHEVQIRQLQDRVSGLEDRNRELSRLKTEAEQAKSQLELQLQAISEGGPNEQEVSTLLTRAREEIDGLRDEIGTVEIERDELRTANEELRTELAEARSSLAIATADAPEDEDEPGEDGPPEPSAPIPAARQDGGATVTEINSRKRPVKVTVEQARDFIVDTIGEREFASTELKDHFDISSTSAQRLVAELLEQKIIKRPANSPTMGPRVRYQLNRDPVPTPKAKPRGENLIDVPKRNGSGEAVPGTGKPAGPASTPGKLRRQQKRAPRVKHKPVKGVRL